MKEKYVTNPNLNREIDESTYKLLQLRDIYYVIPYNAFTAVKRIDETGRKIYSDLSNFLRDSTTNIGNYYITDDYIAKNCILIKDIETLDKYAYQRDQSINIPATDRTPELKYVGGSYTVFNTWGGDEDDTGNKDWGRYVELWDAHKTNPAFTKLKSDPPIELDLDYDFPELDDFCGDDDHNLDY